MMESAVGGFRDAGRIIILASALGIAYNFSSPHGIPLIRTTQVSLPTDIASEPLVIDINQAQQLFLKGEAIFLDARNEEDYMLGHIKGALSLPLTKLEKELQRLSTIPKDALLITYCGGEDCATSTDLAFKLASLGYTNVRIFFAGWGEWMRHNLPVETGPPHR